MIAMDGNNSLKRIARVGNRAVGDVRVFDSDYFLSRDFVDEFADEVKASRPSHEENEDDENTESGVLPEGGDPADGEGEPTPCANNWKAAATDDKKTMWGIFEETGCFASACRHGFLLWIADMVRSGELYVISFQQ
jgi:hypothetical protein